MGKEKKASNKFKTALMASKSIGKQMHSKFDCVHKWAHKQLESIKCAKFRPKVKDEKNVCHEQKNECELKSEAFFYPEDDSLDEYFNDLQSVYELDVNNKYQLKIRKQEINVARCSEKECQMNQTISFATLFNNLDLFSQETQSVRTYVDSEAETNKDLDEQGFLVNFSVEYEDAVTIPGMITRF